MNQNKKIKKENIRKFFKERAKSHDEKNPLKTVIYQDKNPSLAIRRNKYEKKKILDLINFDQKDKVLDVGCGIGRWTDEVSSIVTKYIGVDSTKEFIDIAKKKFKDKKNVKFFCSDANKLNSLNVKAHSPYNVIMIMGLLVYLDDKECFKFFEKIQSISSRRSMIIIREPVATKKELLLDNVWSEEMETNYSAIYRSYKWYYKSFKDFFLKKGYKITIDEKLFPNYLNNRIQTRQHLFCLKRL